MAQRHLVGSECSPGAASIPLSCPQARTRPPPLLPPPPPRASGSHTLTLTFAHPCHFRSPFSLYLPRVRRGKTDPPSQSSFEKIIHRRIVPTTSDNTEIDVKRARAWERSVAEGGGAGWCRARAGPPPPPPPPVPGVAACHRLHSHHDHHFSCKHRAGQFTSKQSLSAGYRVRVCLGCMLVYG